jgi:Zn-dependent protease
MTERIADLLTVAPGFIAGLTLHEFSHALAASRLGDSTAQSAGRLTLNPLAHLDLFGTLALVFAGFGWAKPVPVNPHNMRHPRRDMAIVALAGPVSNLILAMGLSILLRFLIFPWLPPQLGASLLPMILIQAVWINIILAVFNMIPLPPLDGSRILAGIVPESWNYGYEHVERFGPMILLGLILLASATGYSVLGRIISPVAGPLLHLFLGV